jgi:hypothetical protein
MPLDDGTRAVFDRVYTTELVFEPDCWKLCGDAHCCHFSRHKAKFRMMAKGDTFQELPLLPGEWEYLNERGWAAQFGEHELRASTYAVGDHAFRVEAVISHRPMCACNHGTRTTICRLYPLLPVLDSSGALLKTEALGAYEEMELLDGLEPACQIRDIPSSQLDLFNGLAGLLGSHPVLRVYMRAYHLVKRHVFDRLASKRASGVAGSAFQMFESGYLRRQLIDHAILQDGLARVIEEARQEDVEAFDAAWAGLHAQPVSASSVP